MTSIDGATAFLGFLLQGRQMADGVTPLGSFDAAADANSRLSSCARPDVSYVLCYFYSSLIFTLTCSSLPLPTIMLIRKQWLLFSGLLQLLDQAL